MTGSDYLHLHGGQEVTVSFWCKTAAANSGDTYSLSFINSNVTRSYVTNFTATSSWTKITKTITTDNTGTWLFTESGIGLRLNITLMSASAYNGTADTWEGANDLGTSSTSNFMDSTSNEFYISQLSLVKGSTAPTFTSPPIATVKNQVDYYVQRYDYDTVGAETIAVGHCFSTGQNYCHFDYRRKMRIAPAGSSSASSSFVTANAAGGGGSLSGGPHFSGVGKNACRFYMQKTSSDLVAGNASMFHRNGSNTCWLMLDARH
jgi:hypothetical protein